MTDALKRTAPLTLALLGLTGCTAFETTGFLSMAPEVLEIAPNGDPVRVRIFGGDRGDAPLTGWATVTAPCGMINGVPASDGAHVWIQDNTAELTYRCDSLSEACCNGIVPFTAKADAYTAEAKLLLNCGLIQDTERTGLGIFIMLDRSGSMSSTVSGSTTRWQAVTSAIISFVKNSPSTTGVGLGYFGFPTMYTCEPKDYAAPAVPITPLPAGAALVEQSIKANSPSTGTPTSAALEGAILYTKNWQLTHPGTNAIAILATDGEPAECNTDPTAICNIAAAGLTGKPKVLTFVIGVGFNMQLLNDVAKAGGTGNAFMIGGGADMEQQLLNAFTSIRDSTATCRFGLPQAKYGTPDYDSMKVLLSGTTTMELGKVADTLACGTADGWFFDDPADPTQAILCDASCRRLKQEPDTKVEFLAGCQVR